MSRTGDGPVKQKLDLAARYELAWRALNEALAGLDDADFERQVYRQWTLKDVVGHLYSYLHLMLRHVQSYKKRKRLASPRAPSYSYFNRREAARLKSAPIAQLRTDMAADFHELIVLLPTLDREDLKKRFPSQWWNSRYQTSLQSLLREEAGHIQIHAGDIGNWRAREKK